MILNKRDNVFIMVYELRHWVVMGVAGCGKSSLAQAWAAHSAWACVEGDDLHSPAARAHRAAGVALDERHRRPWLRRLVRAMQATPGPCVAAASLLRCAHRQQLRAGLPGVRFVHLQLPLAEAQARCAARAGHFFPPALVASQYAALQNTDAEADVLALDGRLPLPQLLQCLEGWQHAPA
jgi:gluconokinase